MPFRVVALVAALCLAGTAVAREPAASGKPGAVTHDMDQSALSPARERQKRCGVEWRGLSAAEKTARGPTWPKFYSACVKRLKDPKA